MQAGKPFQIVPLADAVQTIPLLARLFLETWEPYYGKNGPGNAKTDLQECCNRDDLPIALVAMDRDGTVLGTAALKSESLGAELAPGPWLAALVVPFEHRKRGVATALVEAIETLAGRLGFESIYTSTDEAENIVKQRGWMRMDESTESLRGPVAIYRSSRLVVDPAPSQDRPIPQ